MVNFELLTENLEYLIQVFIKYLLWKKIFKITYQR